MKPYKLLIALILLQPCFLNTACASGETKAFLADRHQAREVSCKACHGGSKPNADIAAIGKNCQACHGTYQQAVDRTKKKFPEVNPHDQHDGDLSCAACHKGHRKGVNYCEECHGTFVFDVP